MSFISVPCAGCSASVGFHHERCPGCGAAPSPEMEKALEARLEASDNDYRAAKNAVDRASTILLIISIVHIAFAITLYVYAMRSPSVSDAMTTSVIQSFVRGVLLLACFDYSKRDPRNGFGAAVAVEVIGEIMRILFFPMAFFGSFLSSAGIMRIMGEFVICHRFVAGMRAGHEMIVRRQSYKNEPD